MKNKTMKRNILLFMSLCIIVSFGFFFNNKEDKISEVTDGDIPSVASNIPRDAIVNASYIDSFDTINQLNYEADIVVVGKVKKQREHEYGLSIISEIDIKEIYYDDLIENKIEVLQLKGNDVLDKSKTYVLFLKKQEDTQYQYYVLGYGKQGIFEVNGSSILPIDDVMKGDFRKIKSNEKYRNSLEIDTLKDSILKKNKK